MIIIWICAGVGALLCGVACIMSCDPDFGIVMRSILKTLATIGSVIGGAILGFIVGGILAFIIGLGATWTVPRTTVMDSSTKIYSVVDNITTEGHFGIFYGSIKGVAQYYYFADAGVNGRLMQNVDASNTYLQTTNGDPVIERYKNEWNSAWYNWAFDLSSNEYYVLKVPEDTVKYQYNIDSE